MKFCKQFEDQLVPEWKEDFVDYWQLKKNLKRIQILDAQQCASSSKTQEPPVAHRLFSHIKAFLLFEHNDHEVLQVHKKLKSSENGGVLYKTEFLEQFGNSDEAKDFFNRLDLQLIKVNQFYKAKEEEFVQRLESLKKQLQILLELKKELENEGRGLPTSNEEEYPSISRLIKCEEESMKESIGEALKDKLDGNLITDSSRVSDGVGKSEKARPKELKPESFSDSKLSFLKKNVKIKISHKTLSTRFSTLKGILWDDLSSLLARCGAPQCGKLSVNKSNLHQAQKITQAAFLELYKGLGCLETYRKLNMLAFVKILKKFEKITGQQVQCRYIKVVEISYFNSSDKEMKMTDEVEELFVKHFTECDRTKARKYLKPQTHKESHAVTFYIGENRYSCYTTLPISQSLFTGCLVELLLAYFLMAYIAGIHTVQSYTAYMEIAYPILSMFALVFLHLFLYGCNVYMWREARISYALIFDFAPTKYLKCSDIFLICTMSMTLVVAVMLVHLVLIERGYPPIQIQAIPGFLVLIFLAVLLFPLNIIYRSSRYHLLKVMRNIIFSPLYKAVMVDYFMAEQLCSQVPMLRSLEHVACYYATSGFRLRDYGSCMKTKNYRELAYAISFLPYYWRIMQCARSWLEEHDMSHLINLGKYVSVIIVAGANLAYDKEKTMGWLVFLVIMSTIATIYQLYWDFMEDWGFLQPNLNNSWIRNQSMLRRKFIHILSMGLNFILRFAWLQTILYYNFAILDYRVTAFLFAALEVTRRCHWNFYRLENEHLKSTRKPSAIKPI